MAIDEDRASGMIGTVLDARYRILHKVGEGGVGQVYLAEHVPLGRREAIKVLQPEVAVDPQFVSRFRREARAANRLQHPNIISVYDFGRLPDGRMFLAMEFADGIRLDQLLKREGALVVQRALHITAQLALAVDHAHSRGVIHRDLKPSNVILVDHKKERDLAKILDFGLAKIVAPEYSELIQVTARGDIFGTPAYMAPEQFRGEGSDPRSDIYALGCILFELLVGEPPFTGHNMELMQAHTRTPPPRASSHRVDAAISAELDAVIDACMEKDPDQRPQTGRDVFAILERVPGFHTVSAPAKAAHRFGAGLPLDFGEDSNVSTASHSFNGHFGDAIANADTQLLSAEELLRSRQEALLELGEALLDCGINDMQITVCVAELHGLADDVLRTELDSTELGLREAKVEQTRREREGSLRFAIGELKFDRDQANSELRVELDDKLAALEERLTRLFDRYRQRLDEITEEAIEIAATRSTLQDKCADAFGRLEVLVTAAIPAFDDDLAIAPLIDRFLSIVEMSL